MYRTPDGRYKYLQTVSIYLVMPFAPAIIFGILSKRVTAMGALVSVIVGCILASIFVTDQLLGVAGGSRLFPWLHTTLTLNYTYRGLLGTIIIVITMFVVSSFTKKTDPAKIEQLTVSWKGKSERFAGILTGAYNLLHFRLSRSCFTGRFGKRSSRCTSEVSKV